MNWTNFLTTVAAGVAAWVVIEYLKKPQVSKDVNNVIPLPDIASRQQRLEANRNLANPSQ